MTLSNVKSMLIRNQLLFTLNKTVFHHLSRRVATKTMEILEESQISALCSELAPPLVEGKHKGQAGRIGVIGGSLEYTGAPYFSGFSALKVGADITHIFCTTQAASVIKSYSPELIVHPLLNNKESVQGALEWLDRLHVLVIGPGLGRDDDVFSAVSIIIEKCRELKKPLVIDADGLFLVTKNPELIKDYPAGVILTPNMVEFGRLFGSSEVKPGLLNIFGPNCTVVRKGREDEIFDSTKKVNCSAQGSARRCGGQGDLLSGSMATFYCWALNQSPPIIREDLRSIVAGYAGCKLTRQCNARAFTKYKRSMTTSDMLKEIGNVFYDLFEVKK